MNYFVFRTSSDPKIIGVKNGIYQAEIDKKKYRNASDYDNLLKFFSGLNWFERKHKPDFAVEIHANLLKSAIKTDILQFSPHLMACPFLISKKVKDIFENYNIQRYVLYPAFIYEKDGQIDDSYSLFFCEHQGYDIVDFPQSEFYSGNEIIGKEFMKFNNLEEYRNALLNVSPLINIEKLSLNGKFDKSLDFFYGRLGEMHVSETLKDKLNEEKVTGVTFQSNSQRINLG